MIEYLSFLSPPMDNRTRKLEAELTEMREKMDTMETTIGRKMEAIEKTIGELATLLKLHLDKQ